MKFLLITLEYPPFFGGISRYYGKLAEYWPDRDNIVILHNNHKELIDNRLPFLKWLPSIWRLVKTARKHSIDEVLVGQILPLGTSALIAKKIFRIPYSVFLHGMDFSFAVKNFRKRKLAHFILKNSNHIICSNSKLAEDVGEFLETKERITIVNPGVDEGFQANAATMNRLSERYRLQEKFILLSIGRLVDRKGFLEVIDVVNEMKDRYPNLMYVMLGKGPLEENIRAKIGSLDTKNIILIDEASDEEKNAWLEICDVFIMVSKDLKGDYEGFGIVYLEANMAGKPVIAGDSGGVKDAVIDNITGILVDPLDKNATKDAIDRLINDNEKRKILGENGKRRAKEYFLWPVQILKLYKAVTAKHNRNL
jgi:phosphatidyl-myo-inositol dimannoside synthase